MAISIISWGKFLIPFRGILLDVVWINKATFVVPLPFLCHDILASGTSSYASRCLGLAR